MEEDARRGGGVSTCSDGTHAKALGVSRMTIRRWKCQLERDARISRDGYHVWHPRCKTVRYRVRVTQGVKPFKSVSPSGLRTNRYVRTNAFGCATNRGKMEASKELATQRLANLDYPRNAQGAIATVCDTFMAKGIPIASRHKGMLARQAKELLSDGFEFETVVIASVIALRRGEPQNAHFIAGDLVMARAGERMTRRQYEKALQDEMELR